MASKKDPDEVKVNLMIEITVSERAYTEMFKDSIAATKKTVPAHVAMVARIALDQHLATLGFPQER